MTFKRGLRYDELEALQALVDLLDGPMIITPCSRMSDVVRPNSRSRLLIPADFCLAFDCNRFQEFSALVIRL